MAFNGTGTFTRLYNWVNDKANGFKITASRMDGEFDGIATGLSTCITKDGQTTITANIPFANYKITGLGTGNARSDSLNIGQLQDNQFLYLGTTSGSADAYTLAPTPTITSYATTQQFTVKIHATNTTTTPYLQISGIANPSTTAVIKKLNASKAEIAVEDNDLIANGIYKFQRNSANDAWIVLNPSKPKDNYGSYFFANLRTFTSSGTYTPTAGTRAILVKLVGGGGGGAGSNSSTVCVGGGGGGGGAESFLTTFTSTVAMTVGAGGTAGSSANGGNGGTTSFGSYLSATGGTGGTMGSGNGSAGGVGTVSSGNGFAVNGSGGGTGQSRAVSGTVAGDAGGAGGNSMLGGGGRGGNYSGTAGGAGSVGGGGGSALTTGGAGGDGIIIVYEYF
jgi:hypothetical protein